MRWSAPASSSARILLPEPLATATTIAPSAFATCTAARPTPPAAPRTSTVWPGVTRAYRVRARCAVPKATGNAAACARLTPAGTGKHTRSGMTHSSAIAPPPIVTPATRSPTLSPRTSVPHSVTTPAHSPPGMNGMRGFSWYEPWTIKTSAKFRLAASTLTLTQSRGHVGDGTSSTANAPPSDRGLVGSPSVRHSTALIRVPLPVRPLSRPVV
mmetsp:Transcript_4183/g.15537  ORF Transcript_4183/g.15537 Transcript_4183/m.15537 type:complete len:213 (+) Transcript_4183:546-1184(+)